MASSWGGAFRTGFGRNRGSMGGRGGFGGGFGGGFRSGYDPTNEGRFPFHPDTPGGSSGGGGGGNQPWWQAMMPYAMSALGGWLGPDAQNAKLAREKEAARQKELDEEIKRRNEVGRAAAAAMTERWGGG